MRNYLNYSPISVEGLEIKEEFINHQQSFSLFIDGIPWMTTQDIDLKDHSSIDSASGKIVLTGLGLGVGVIKAALNYRITDIMIIEIDDRVIKYVWPMVQKNLQLVFNRTDRLIPINLLKTNADDVVPIGYDFAFLDHYKENIPDNIIRIYKKEVPIVVTWWEERLKLNNRSLYI